MQAHGVVLFIVVVCDPLPDVFSRSCDQSFFLPTRNCALMTIAKMWIRISIFWGLICERRRCERRLWCAEFCDEVNPADLISCLACCANWEIEKWIQDLTKTECVDQWGVRVGWWKWHLMEWMWSSSETSPTVITVALHQCCAVLCKHRLPLVHYKTNDIHK